MAAFYAHSDNDHGVGLTLKQQYLNFGNNFDSSLYPPVCFLPYCFVLNETRRRKQCGGRAYTAIVLGVLRIVFQAGRTKYSDDIQLYDHDIFLRRRQG